MFPDFSFRLKGRVRRSQYFFQNMFWLCTCLIVMVPLTVDLPIYGGAYFTVILVVASLVLAASVSLFVRRARDIGWEGWRAVVMYFLQIVPLLGVVPFLAMFLLPSDWQTDRVLRGAKGVEMQPFKADRTDVG